MIKLAIFDVDNTLAEPNKPIDNKVIGLLKKIEDSGVRIALISGKPVVYLSGLARQIRFRNPIISGENGAHIYYSSNFPPQKKVVISVRRSEAKILEELKLSIIREFDDKVWIQPNMVNLTIFPKNKKIKYELFQYVDAFFDEILSKKFKIYKHLDSIEIIPLIVNKGAALRKIKALEKLKREEVVAVGDGENDIDMFREAGTSIGINLPDTTYTFSSIEDAIKFILIMIEDENNHEQGRE